MPDPTNNPPILVSPAVPTNVSVRTSSSGNLTKDQLQLLIEAIKESNIITLPEGQDFSNAVNISIFKIATGNGRFSVTIENYPL